jgi:2-oxoglutarate dehydrogenase E2 component (dihydrolipoamide succinyltransferase)
MPVEIRVPSLGESVVEATVGRWLKQPGDPVAQGDALVELETDKVNVEVPATEGGTLESISVSEGDTVTVGDLLGLLGAPSTASPNGRVQDTKPTAPSTPASETAASSPEVAATPVARRLAEDKEIDLSTVKGSGPHGKVTKTDVEAAAAKPSAASPVPAAQPTAAPSASASSSREERIRMSRRRQTIAQRLVEAQHTAAMLTTFNEVDMTAVMELRRRYKESFQKKYGVGLGFMSFFTKAAVGALKAFPLVNAEIQGTELVIKHYYDIGIAVSTEEGLVVPVLRDADQKSFAQIEQGILELAVRAREGRLTLPELMGGTFTITNGGVFGSLMSTPILNTPQVGILGMHKIQERPMAVNGQVVVRPMMYLALSYDHRIVDGREAVQFLVKVKEYIEQPESLLLEM